MKNNGTYDTIPAEVMASTDILEIIFKDRLNYSTLVSAAVDHGLHTPIVIIKGLAEILLRDPDQDPRENLKKISREADHILKLLTAMTFVAPIEPVQMQNLSLREMVDRVVIYFEKRCLENGISLTVNISQNIRVEADPNRLKSILISLLQNAVDSFDNVPAAAPRSILIHTQSHDERLDLVISDTGSGMTSQVQDNVVNKIFLDKAEKHHLESHLGLALAQKMSNDLGIKLGLVSEKEKGTSFTLSFPKP